MSYGMSRDIDTNMRIQTASDQMLSHVQIFGERNSGTNHLRKLVEENMHNPENFLGSYSTNSNPENTARRFGYKHYYADAEKIKENQSDTLFLVIYKNPYTWIRSTLHKPYHFKSCLNGKSIYDLPSVRLFGTDSRGRQIPDVHPESGENIDIFELRHHKIQNWENLKNLVDNVAYINYETLLLEPTKTIQSILINYASLFKVSKAPVYVTDKAYLDKYSNPQTFSESEMEVLNTNIFWNSENFIGYEKNDLFITSANPTVVRQFG